MRTDVDACDFTRGLYGHRKEVCTGSRLWEKNPLPHLGHERESVLRLAFQSDALMMSFSWACTLKFNDHNTHEHGGTALTLSPSYLRNMSKMKQ